MEITAILIPANQAAPVKLRKLDRHNLAAYQALVGGNIEPVHLDAPAASMYVNEEGKLLHLRLNMRATHVVWAHNERLRNEDIVMGDAFILGPVDQNGEDLTVPRRMLTCFFPASRSVSKSWLVVRRSGLATQCRSTPGNRHTWPPHRPPRPHGDPGRQRKAGHVARPRQARLVGDEPLRGPGHPSRLG